MAEQELKMTLSQLKDIIESAVRAATAPNPLEQKALDEALQTEKRRAMLAVELGRAEEQGRWLKQNSCSHSRDKNTGEAVRKGTGVWTTGGQMHGDGAASLVCQRCATTWRFRPTPAELEYIQNSSSGLMGFAPPDLDRCINRDDFVLRRPA
jgi:hypothetical protein